MTVITLVVFAASVGLVVSADAVPEAGMTVITVGAYVTRVG